MKLSCPACGAMASLDVLIGHEGARDAVMAALSLPAPMGKQLVQYIALFRPASRNLSMDRLANLLGELQLWIAAAKFEREGRIWNAPIDYWKLALDEMIGKRDKLTLPLKSHGYLLAIIQGYGLKAELKVENQQEDRKAGRSPVGGISHPSHAACPELVEGKKPKQEMPKSVKAAISKGVLSDE